MNDKLNVLFISGWYPCPSNPHNGNFVVRHAAAVSSYANVFVIHVCPDDNLKTPTKVVTEKGGFKEIRIVYPRMKSRLPMLGEYFKFLKIRRLYVKAFLELEKELGKIDLIHANVIFPIGMIATYLNRRYHVPYVVTEHWTGFMPNNRDNLSGLILRQSKRIAKKAARIMPVSRDLKNSMQSLGIQAKYEVVYNVVDTDLFTLKELVHKPFRFIHVSSLDDRQKNISGILRVIKTLANMHLDFTMHLVGDGDTRPHKKYAKELGIPDDKLLIEGIKPIDEIAGLMRQSDVFVLFSNYESFSCVISEALCTGMPVISSDAGAIRERLDKSNGIIINPGDEEALRDSMKYMIENYASYDNNSIRSEAITKYNYHVVGKRLVVIYNEVLKG